MTHVDDAEPALPSSVATASAGEAHENRQAVAETLAAWVNADVVARGRPGEPTIRLQAVEEMAHQVEELVAEERRRAALFALSVGLSAASIGAELGLSRWAVAKRWPDLAEQARPLRWLYTNQTDWARSLDDLLALAEPRAARLDDDQREALTQLRELVDGYRSRTSDWWLLVETPRLARAVLTAVVPRPDDQLGDHVVCDWLFAQVADYDLTSSGEKKHPRTEVSYAAVRAATEARLARR